MLTTLQRALCLGISLENGSVDLRRCLVAFVQEEMFKTSKLTYFELHQR